MAESSGEEMAPNGAAEPSRQLYTIPSSAGWFQWGEIHETEKRALPEFFEGVSTTKNPRVYKEYRDFIINKYRQDTSKRLTFTEVRKALIGDVSLLQKLFSFLENWGLVNFSVPVKPREGEEKVVETKVLVEDGAPYGLRVVSDPAMVVVEMAEGKGIGEKKLIGGEKGVKLPPLTSYSDVYGEWDPRKGSLCGLCGERCLGGHYKIMEDGLKLCSNCSKSTNGDKGETMETKPLPSPAPIPSLPWTDSETLLLLEGVLKLGDDWDLIAKHVRTRSKTECIARLLQIPFGEPPPHIVGPTNGRSVNTYTLPDARSKPVEIGVLEGSAESNGEVGRTSEDEEPPEKKSRVGSYASATESLIKQVAWLCAISGPRVTAAAADAAITELCSESDHAKETFDINNSEFGKKFTLSNQEPPSNVASEDGQQAEAPQETEIQVDESEEKFTTTAYRIRAAVATAIGATAARAKVLADHEETEMQLLMATIIDAQMRKLEYKMKHFADLEALMNREYDILQQEKKSLVREWVGLLRQAFQTGVPRWKDNAAPKPLIVRSTP